MNTCNLIDKIEKFLIEKLDSSYSSWDQVPLLFDLIPESKNAVERIIKALNNNEIIYFVHDSDADGVGSATVCNQFFDFIDYKNRIHRITNRKDGYGFLPLHVDEALQQGAKLIITTDNGITSKQAVEYARSKNIDVIITDHHTVDRNKFPSGAIVIDPWVHNLDKFTEISGTAVIYFLLEAVASQLGFERAVLQQKVFLTEELGLTTISDVMPMQHINRLFVKDALKWFNEPRKPYTQVFKANLKYEDTVTAETIGFSLAPVLNAANRFGIAETAFDFLTANSYQDAMQYWTYLTFLNEKRKQLIQQYVDMLQGAKIEFGDLVYVNLNNVEKGVLGLLANKLASFYNKPTIVTCTTENGMVHGSGRSVGQVDMLSILKDIGVEAGGHKQAFGCEFEYRNIPQIVKLLSKKLKEVPRELFAEPDKSNFKITFDQITKDLFELLNKFEPYGPGFEKPVFATDATVVKAYKFGKQNNHTKFILKDNNGTEREMIAFFETRNFQPGEKLQVNYTLYWDSWNQEVSGRINQIFRKGV